MHQGNDLQLDGDRRPTGEENAKVVESCAGALVSLYVQIICTYIRRTFTPSRSSCSKSMYGFLKHIVHMLLLDFHLRLRKAIMMGPSDIISTNSSSGLGE